MRGAGAGRRNDDDGFGSADDDAEDDATDAVAGKDEKIVGYVQCNGAKVAGRPGKERPASVRLPPSYAFHQGDSASAVGAGGQDDNDGSDVDGASVILFEKEVEAQRSAILVCSLQVCAAFDSYAGAPF